MSPIDPDRAQWIDRIDRFVSVMQNHYVDEFEPVTDEQWRIMVNNLLRRPVVVNKNGKPRQPINILDFS